ncbi:MAG: hypothetical protein AMXMBFR84_47390 [Candidatus Hydrogenedentota bacterium]
MGMVGPNQDWRSLAYLREHFDSHAEGALDCAAHLRDAVAALPRVYQERHSECFFAEALYARKEEAEQQAQSELLQFQECLAFIWSEQARLSRRVRDVDRAAETLHHDAPKNLLREGEDSILEDIRWLGERQVVAAQVIDALKAALAESVAKQLPLGRASKRFCPVSPSAPMRAPALLPPEPSLDAEIEAFGGYPGVETSMERDRLSR